MRGMHIYLFKEQIFTKTKRANFNFLQYLLYFFVSFALIMDPTESCGPGRGPNRNKITAKIRPLVFGESIPNVSENSVTASGSPEGRILINTTKFKALEANYNSDIEFLDLEGTGESRMMTKRLKERLNTLAVSVLNQWDGVKLAVRRGWSELEDDDPQSLHYEGRAVDILTSDKKKANNGVLARLAVQAGFDWVYYEKKAFIHCSVKSESSASSKSTGCFTGDSTVRTRDGPKRLSNVQVGEELLAMNPETGSLEYSPLMLFLDRQPNVKHLYVHIKTSSGQKIKLTPSHLIMRWEKTRSNLSNFTSLFSYNAVPTFAKNINVNDKVIINRDNRIHLDSVDSVNWGFEQGMYAPLTEMGTVVVDDVVASCYAVLDSQDLAHLAFLPYRLVYNLNHSFNRFYKALSGLISSKPTSTVSRTTPSTSQIGIHWYAKFLHSIAYYIVPPSMMYEQ